MWNFKQSTDLKQIYALEKKTQRRRWTKLQQRHKINEIVWFLSMFSISSYSFTHKRIRKMIAIVPS